MGSLSTLHTVQEMKRTQAQVHDLQKGVFSLKEDTSNAFLQLCLTLTLYPQEGSTELHRHRSENTQPSRYKMEKAKGNQWIEETAQ